MSLAKIPVEIPNDEYWRRQIKCQYACPVGTDARGYVRAIAEGDFEAAYLIARGPNPLASICGRVCGAPCEAACRRGTVDQAVSIRALKRFVTDRHGPDAFTRETLKPLALLKRVIARAMGRDCKSQEEIAALSILRPNLVAPPAGGEKVAIIGSGPAGLAAAHDLALLGLRPVVYEMEPVPAGMLAVGIPEYRLPRALIAAEVEVIRSLGVEFVCNTQIGRDISFAELRRTHRATIVAVGAKRSRRIPVTGGDGPGVLGGVEFLRDVSLRASGEGSTLGQLGKSIVVIGGGNVAFDVSRTVIRQVGFDVSRSALRQAGVRNVHLCCLESLDEMPADDVEILEGHEEGVLLHTSLGPEAVVRDPSGKVTGVRFKRCLRVFGDDGRFAPKFDEADVTEIPADTVIWAVGQRPDVSFIEPDSGVKVDERGAIAIDADTLRSSAPDVFVAGDLAHGPRLLIDAVASGKRCARSVYEHITGHKLRPGTSSGHEAIRSYARERDYEKLPRTSIPTLEVGARVASQETVVERGYDEARAVAEACRCLDCGVNTIFDSERCILCGGCADVCPELCLRLVSCDRLTGDPGLEEALRERYGDVDLSTVSAIVKDEDRCIRCALCAERCPVDAIAMERYRFERTWETFAV